MATMSQKSSLPQLADSVSGVLTLDSCGQYDLHFLLAWGIWQSVEGAPVEMHSSNAGGYVRDGARHGHLLPRFELFSLLIAKSYWATHVDVARTAKVGEVVEAKAEDLSIPE